MTGNCCAVLGCTNVSRHKIKTEKAEERVIYHRFPKPTDKASTMLRKKWVDRCCRDKFNPNTSRVCSVHFTNSDYERDLQNELLGLPLRRILKKTAIPNANLPRQLNNKIKPICKININIKQEREIDDNRTNKPSKHKTNTNIKEEKEVDEININNTNIPSRSKTNVTIKEEREVDEININKTNTPRSKTNVNIKEEREVDEININKTNIPSRHKTIINIKEEKEVGDLSTSSLPPNIDACNINILHASCSTQNHNVSSEFVSMSAHNKIMEKYDKLRTENFYLKEKHRQFKLYANRKMKSLSVLLRYYKNKNKETNRLTKTEDSHNLLEKIMAENKIAVLVVEKEECEL